MESSGEAAPCPWAKRHLPSAGPWGRGALSTQGLREEVGGPNHPCISPAQAPSLVAPLCPPAGLAVILKAELPVLT